MTKSELIQQVKTTASAGELEVSTAVAEACVNATFDALVGVMTSGDHITVQKFGKFGVVFRKGKTGKVPGTDKTYTSADKYAPKFSPSEYLMKTVAEKVEVK